MSDDDAECEYFTVVSIGSLLVYKNKYYLQAYSNNFANKVIDKQIIHCLDENPFEIDEN